MMVAEPSACRVRFVIPGQLQKAVLKTYCAISGLSSASLVIQ